MADLGGFRRSGRRIPRAGEVGFANGSMLHTKIYVLGLLITLNFRTTDKSAVYVSRQYPSVVPKMVSPLTTYADIRMTMSPWSEMTQDHAYSCN